MPDKYVVFALPSPQPQIERRELMQPSHRTVLDHHLRPVVRRPALRAPAVHGDKGCR